MSHTPGPWRAAHRCAFAKPNEDEVGGLGWEIEGPPEASDRGQFARAADAHLMAAAPDLFEALTWLLQEFEAYRDDPEGLFREFEVYRVDPEGGMWPEAMEQARYALARARGEA